MKYPTSGKQDKMLILGVAVTALLVFSEVIARTGSDVKPDHRL